MSSPRVAVIGSGVAGASAAFALAVRGAAVVIVDKVLPGQATAAGAGIIEPWSSTSAGPAYELSVAGASYYPTLLQHLEAVGVSRVGYRVAGALVVDADPAQLAEVEKRLRHRASSVSIAGAVQQLDERQARELFPALAPDLRAVHVPGGARVDGRQLRGGLLAGAQRLGAVVVDSSAQLKVTRAGSWAVHTSERRIEADAVVVACGAWVDGVLEPLNYRLAVEPQRGQLVRAFAPPE